MADGDLAAAAGLAVFSGNQDRRQGYNNDNIRGDELARHMTDGGHDLAKPGMTGILPVAKGGTGATKPGEAASSIGAVRQGGGVGMGTNVVRMGWAADSSGLIVQVDSTVLGKVAFKGDIPTPDLSAYQRKGENYEAGSGVLISAGGRNSQVVQGYVAAYWNGDGTLRSTPSARRFKQDIQTYEMTEEEVDAFLAIPAVHYRLIAMVNDHGDEAPVEFGFIAEDVMEHGYESVVPLDNMIGSETYGEPISVDYARLVVPLQIIAKQQRDQLAQLRAAVDELRAEVDELRALITPTEGND